MTGQRPRVGLYGYFGMGNIGNEGSLAAMVSWLRQAHPDLAVHCYAAVPEAVRRDHGIPATRLMSFRADPRQRGLWADARKAVARAWDIPRTFAMMGDVDILVVPGTGVLESKLVARPWGLPYWLFLATLACRLRGRKVALVSVGAERPTHPVTARLYRWTAALATYCTFRDEESRDAVRRMGVRVRDDAVFPDLAFALPAPEARPRPGHVVLGVMEYEGSPDDPGRGREVVATYVQSMVQLVGRLLAGGRSVTLVVGDEADFALAWQVADKVRADLPERAGDGRLSVSPARTLDAVVSEMSRAEVVVASRFHNVISALMTRRPTVSLGYAEKNRNLLDRFGLGDFSRPADSFDPQDVARLVAKAREVHPGGEAFMEKTLLEIDEELDVQFRRLSEEVFGGAP